MTHYQKRAEVLGKLIPALRIFKSALEEGAIGLMPAWDSKRNEPVVMLVARAPSKSKLVLPNGEPATDELTLWPLAVMCEEDPKQRYWPPSQDEENPGYIREDGTIFIPEE